MTRKYWGSFIRLIFLTILFSASFLIIVDASPQDITVYYFVAEGCEHCIRAENYISMIKMQYPNIAFQRFDIFNNDTNIELFITLAEGFNITEEFREVPTAFIGDTYLIGEEDIIQNLENLILEYSGGEYYDKAGEIIRDFIEKNRPPVSLPSLASVVIAAFIDSLNPCAFATIILLLTYSVSTGSPKRMLVNCGAFIMGVLISYLSAGIGLLYLINIAPFRIFLRYLVGLVAIVFAALEFKEFLFYGKGLSLEQPGALSRIINRYSASMTIGAGFLIGMAVSMVELPCTGGIYITIIYILAKIGLTLEVFLLLLLYNLIFVLPLIVIILLVYFGRSVMEIDAWRIEKRRYMRLLAGILLLTVGIAMISGLI
ncbi:MAG: cytochrome c biogenesis protein [Thermoproteota archaeon]